MSEVSNQRLSENQRLELSELHQTMEREWTAVQSDLQRARALLHEGMGRIQEFFDTVQRTTDMHRGALARLYDADGHARAVALSFLSNENQRLLAEREGVLVGLQLDDILGQLLEYTQQRAEGGGRISAVLVEAVAGQVITSRSSLHERLKSAVADVDKRAGSPSVRQQSFATGDVELF